MKFNTVEEAIKAIANGEMIVVVDDDDRENEGDLIMAASKATPEKTGFIIRHTSGIVCAPVTQEIAEKLHLEPMVSSNDAPLGTAFTVSVDCKDGLTTGISATERCNTIRALANGNIGSRDFVRPGHVFPLIAREGGVLMRSGHTEASVDLARLAGEPPVGLLAELMNDDGTVKRGDQVSDFALEHNLKIISVADIITYREQREQLIKRIQKVSIKTNFVPAEAYTYTTPFDDLHHIAIVYGDIGDGLNVNTRIHRENIISDVFGDHSVLGNAMEKISSDGRGVVIYLREGAIGVQSSSSKNIRGIDDKTESENQRVEEWRDIGLGAQILRDLGINSICLISATQSHFVGLSGFGIQITSRNPLE
jgi:3,4-dihydroxy 2-butanone 4-phosphate synthase / GTP cyclohydrolase II